MWITTVVLVVGFGILATSDFRINSDMGLLSAIVIFIALIVDFTILPSALLIFDRKSYVKEDVSHANELSQSPRGGAAQGQQ
ncbi:hypothetical protein [Veronia nyctiphanis]|uniref:hypothetical protein n=1 Tax=Veronia nyctiphanis TaxID=1278244 RepID=UPI001F38A553|nr:hypothetical protein [Veronia nyctiphanis]